MAIRPMAHRHHRLPAVAVYLVIIIGTALTTLFVNHQSYLAQIADESVADNHVPEGKPPLNHPAIGSPASSTIKRGLVANVLPYDEVGESLVIWGTVPWLDSIRNKKWTIQPVYLESKNAFNSVLRGKNGSIPFFSYNPMLLPIDQLEEPFLSAATGRRINNNNQTDDDNVVVAYIGLTRVSSFGHCIGPDPATKPSTKYRNLLAVSLLDADLNILTHSHFSINKDSQMSWNSLQDCQVLFRQGLLHLLCNRYMVPVSIFRFDEDGSMMTNHPQAIALSRNATSEVEMNGEMGRGLRLYLHSQWRDVVGSEAKNLHLFDSRPPTNETFVEVWVSDPKETLPIKNLSLEAYKAHRVLASGEHVLRIGNKSSYFVGKYIKSKKPSTAATGPLAGERERTSSGLRARGSACCVEFKSPTTGEPVLVGISHIKDDDFNYLSRFYAFEPVKPFNPVAQSGLFCLGFPPQNDSIPELSSAVFYHNDDNNIKMRIDNRTYECPRIHFVSGFVQKYNDEQSTLISYGINDCYPRIVEVPKERILRLLYPPDD